MFGFCVSVFLAHDTALAVAKSVFDFHIKTKLKYGLPHSETPLHITESCSTNI